MPLLSVTAVRELARLPRGNQAEVGLAVARRGLTTRQTARLVEQVLSAPAEHRPRLLERAGKAAPPHPRPGARHTPLEQVVADAARIQQLAVRLHVRLLERSVESLGEAACATVSEQLRTLRGTLVTLTQTLDTRLGTRGADDATP